VHDGAVLRSEVRELKAMILATGGKAAPAREVQVAARAYQWILAAPTRVKRPPRDFVVA
jgi:hypothetical protein